MSSSPPPDVNAPVPDTGADAPMSVSDAGGGGGAEDESAGVYSLASRPADAAEGTELLDAQPVSATAYRHDGRRRLTSNSPERSVFWTLLGCNALVFATSACIMVLELTASRLIARHVGQSLYTWTSVIGVVLAGITVGNYVGGWMADRFSAARTLGWLFLVSSVLCFSVLGLDHLPDVVPRPDGWGWGTWVVVVVAAIFFWPAAALGTISPVVASVALRKSARTGITVGSVYAWGAMGSILGTFLAGFWLIDQFGSRQIVALIAAALAGLGAVVAVGRSAFRSAVVFGWLQLVGFSCLALTATSESWGDRGEAVGNLFGSKSAGWRTRAAGVGEHLHRIGLLIGLRADEPDVYYDESNYSLIEIGESTERGDRVKYLKLDKLMHSYYNPARPIELYYDYERIYAALTELAVAERDTTTSVLLAGRPFESRRDPDAPSAEFPDDGAALAEIPGAPLRAEPPRFPDWAHYDPATRRLAIRGGMSDVRRRELLALSPSADWWRLLDDLHERTTASDWGGFESVSVSAPPPEAAIPEALKRVVRYDPLLAAVNVFAPVTSEARASLVAASPHAEYHRAVSELAARSRQVSAFFIGGGGYIFPRWIESRFPHEPRIDVSELDPAVTRAVELHLGLPPAGRTAITTWTGDARNVVDDLLRRNAQRRQAGEPPVLYDFIYGDAFNDFSVPWHLTTREFSAKVAELLTEDGVYLVNLIDILPRTEHPGRTAAQSIESFAGVVPTELLEKGRLTADWAPLRFSGSVKARRRDSVHVELRHDGPMPDATLLALDQAGGDNRELRAAVHRLHASSNSPLPFDGTIPPSLVPAGYAWAWERCPAPFEALELLAAPRAGDPLAPGRSESGPLPHVLGVRGAMTVATRDALLRLDPGNAPFAAAVDDLFRRSGGPGPGRFLARYVHTLCSVLPNVYVFSSEVGTPHDDRDTFVVVASQKPLAIDRIEEHSDYWGGRPFALREAGATGRGVESGMMGAIRELAAGVELTDDYAPVDNLLVPVFAGQK